MKNLKSKKGFSLIELIVVIAVIAAIAAIIVPSISNFSDAAKESADQRNIQLWNSTYATAFSAGATPLPYSVNTPSLTAPDPIDASITINGNTVSFKADGFTLEQTSVTVGFTVGEGLSDPS